MAVLLLAPSPPLLFMGEEFGASSPFLFFCDFGPDLASKVTEGRRAEFARFSQFASAEAQARIPDPNREETFLRSKLDWASVDRPAHIQWLQFFRDLLVCRQREIVPRMKGIVLGDASFELLGHGALSATWPFQNVGKLELIGNFATDAVELMTEPRGRLLYTTEPEVTAAVEHKQAPPISVAWFLEG